jgi:hypothetical protein
MNEKVSAAVETYVALLEFEKATGTITRHTRNSIAQALSNADLAAFALELKKRGLIAGGSK